MRDTSAIALAIGLPAYLALVVLAELGLVPDTVNIVPVSLAIPLLAVPAGITEQGDEEGGQSRLIPIVVWGSFAVALGIRLGLTLAHEIPLGYDPGLYKHVFDVYTAALPNVAESQLPTWIKTIYPQGLPMLITTLATALGIDSFPIARFGLPVVSALLVFPIYSVGRTSFGSRAGAISAAIYAIAYTPLFLFGLFYLKNVVGLYLLLLAIASLQKQRFVLFGVLLGGLAVYHRPTFVVALATVLAFAAIERNRRLLLSLAIAAAIATPFFLLRWNQYLQLVLDALHGATSASVDDQGGTFLDLRTYGTVSLAYQPFALIAVVWAIRTRHWDLPFLLLLATATWIAFQIFFFRRTIIPLDVAMILMAGKGVDLMVRSVGEASAKVLPMGIAAVGVAALAVPAVRYLQQAQPLISPEQLAVVQWIAAKTPANAVVLASAYDAPWVIGWSDRPTIAPGQFDENIHDKNEWLAFLGSEDPSAAVAFLDSYPSPLYIYYSGESASYLDTAKFQGAHFSLVYESAGAEVFSFSKAAE